MGEVEWMGDVTKVKAGNGAYLGCVPNGQLTASSTGMPRSPRSSLPSSTGPSLCSRVPTDSCGQGPHHEAGVQQIHARYFRTHVGKWPVLHPGRERRVLGG